VAPAGLGLLVEGFGGSTVLLGGYPALLGRVSCCGPWPTTWRRA
jgi:hypothetical protein